MHRFALFGWLVLSACVLVACGDDDGGVDNGTPDAAVPIDGSPPCETNEMCDDGVFCNGDEACDDGQCVFGPRRDCNDGVACTVDSCSEGQQMCRNTAPDIDGDGHGDARCVDADGDELGDDCDDERADRFPSNREVCDPMDVDEDCDDSTYGALDSDGDGADSDRCCNVSASNPSDKTCGPDCDDQRDAIKPGASEVCDRLDNNCNGTADEGVTVPQYVDGDRDGHGKEGSPVTQACADSVGFAADDDDCDDMSPNVHRAQVEICDDVDNDCDGDTDEEENSVAWYVDTDGDGFGDPNQPATASCEPLDDHSLLHTDCDDTQAAVNPGAAELCDAIDNDCSGLADFQLGLNDWEDDDNDHSADFGCQPAGLDCDDNDPTTGNGVEICDGYDNDCDDKTDEEVPNTVWYLDLDGDGFGDTSAPAVVLCAPISGRTPFGGDCNDHNVDANPDAKEQCNAQDDDCDGVIDNSADLLEAGCVGQSAIVSGAVYGPQGGTVQLRGSAGRPNKPQGTLPTNFIANAKISVVYHTGTVVGTTTSNANGKFSIRVPRGVVFLIVEPPTNLASGLVGSAIPVNGPRNDVQIYLHVPSDLGDLMPTDLETKGVMIANIVGASHEGTQGVVFDPNLPAQAMVGNTVQSGNTLPPYDVATWVHLPSDPLPFTTVSAVDVAPGAYRVTPIAETPINGVSCTFTEGNFFGNAPIYAQTWPVRANVITWIPVDCSRGLGDCCEANCGSGCDDTGITACMQDLDTGGCGNVDSTWDETCVHRVSTLGCSSCPTQSSCFAAHPAPGCDDAGVEDCVCNDPQLGDPSCCSGTWTDTCAATAFSCSGSSCPFAN